VGYPGTEEEIEILMRREARREDAVAIDPVVGKADLIDMQRHLEAVYVGADVARYMVEIVRATRVDSAVQIGASPRGALALFKLSRASAALQGRDFVTPEDVKGVAVPALAHRIMLTPEQWARGGRETSVVERVLGQVPVPAAQSQRNRE
jgi:MoxR-like ATPase